jgi:hypothetical protein
MKTPTEYFDKFEQASVGLDYGEVTLTLSIKQGRTLYIVSRKESFIPDEEPLSTDGSAEKTG